MRFIFVRRVSDFSVLSIYEKNSFSAFVLSQRLYKDGQGISSDLTQKAKFQRLVHFRNTSSLTGFWFWPAFDTIFGGVFLDAC